MRGSEMMRPFYANFYPPMAQDTSTGGNESVPISIISKATGHKADLFGFEG